MTKAVSGEPVTFEKDFSTRFAKGSEITTLLDDNSCDAIIVPEGCRNPSDLGQAPVICLIYSPSTPVEVDETGLTIKGPGMPFGALLIGRKWDEQTLLSVASAYEQIMEDQLLDQDRLWIFPKTELRDIIHPKVVEE
ncbi:hypothetical protein KVR01_000046 [Diaporthe batatas]|uniref:uncharacterized protein n=1 Tax=Diaporthe batatas TaxID=748121 RepID=UPI001D057043|nr:uncharacterized protein KVR01_000046 [Diaporthe batatas]KAG8169301.1 hypothetical protein KVR01_000046 [Diaporthe batatas]